MRKVTGKFKRTAIAALALALVWMFLLPVQAFAEEEIDTDLPALTNDEGNGNPDAGAEQTEEADDGGEEAAAVPPGSAYLAPGVEDSADPAQQSDGEAVGENPEESVDHGQNQPSDQLQGEPSDQTQGEPSGQTQGEPSDQTQGEPSDQTQGEPQSQQEPQPQAEGGASTDTSGDGDWTRYDNNESANAIQQAVDAAIAAGQKYITVVVQDGTYTGGLNIDNSGNESIVVNIVAHDAYEHSETDGSINTSSETADGDDKAPEAVYPVPTVTDTNGDTVIDNAAINTGSSGGVKLEGGVSVKNVELLLAGIYLTLKEQQENKEATESAAAEENNQDIKVENADNFTYYGTSQDDTVNISLTDVKNAKVDSGDGNDVIEVDTTTSPNVDLTINEAGTVQGDFTGADSVNSNVSVSTGGGNDKITVTQNSMVTFGEDKKTVSVRKGLNELTVDAGDGTDTITLKGDSTLVDIKKNISEEIAKKVYELVSVVVENHGSTAVIKGGADDDQLNLDTSWELGTLGKTAVDYQGGEGKNRLHLTGTLAEVTDRVTGEMDENGSGNIYMHSENTVSRTDYSLVDTDLWLNKTVTELALQSPNTLDIKMADVDALTDDLSGKKTIDVTFENGKIYLVDENGNLVKDEKGDPMEATFEAFTDYVYASEDDTITLISFSNESALSNPGLLTKVIIKGQNLIVGKDVEIYIPGATLMLESTNGAHEKGSILIEGTLEADTIMLKLTSTDSNNIAFLGFDGLGMDPSIMDVNTSATVTIASTAKLIAKRLVDILANTIQKNGLLPDLTDLIPGLSNATDSETINKYVEQAFGFKTLELLKQAASINFVSIKMASAVVNILGSIVAGCVRVSANSKVDTTASNSALRDLGLPFALSVVLSEAGIQVSNGANITANLGDVYLDAQSDVKVNTAAMSGRLPFTVAVSVVDNKAYVDVSGGTLTSTNGNVIANATGIVDLKTSATGSNVRPNNNAVVPSTDNQASNTTTQLEMGKSGGFFAISVLTQDVFAALKDSASAYANNGDITINSTAKASVVNNATSNPGEDGESMTLAKLILMLTGEEETPGDGGIVGKIIDKISSYFGEKETGATSAEEKAEAEKQKEKKTSVLGGFVKKLTGNGNEDGDDVGSLVDKATNSANTGKTDSTKSVQMVGALGVTYANNQNKAYVDTTGTVNAAGKLSVLANGEMKVETLADGSPVKADDPAAGEDEKQDGPEDQHYAAHSHGAVKVDALTNGTILIDASVGSGADGICEILQNNNFPKGIENYDTLTFVVKACLGYKLQADDAGKYWITNEYHRYSDNSTQTEQIEVEHVGKDANGCDVYRVKGAAGYKLFSGENLFKAEFVPKNAITVENNATHMGTVTVSNAQKEGKDLYFADWEDAVYVIVNVKSGITFKAPIITYISDTYDKPQYIEDKDLQMIDKDGNVVTSLVGEVQEDGTTNYYYKLKMPNGKVTMKVDFAGEEMKIGLDSAITTDDIKVWFGSESGEPDKAMTGYQGNVGDKIKIVIELAKDTFLEKNSLMFAGKTPVYIKDITDNGNGQYTCYVNIPAILKTEGDSNAAKDLQLTFKTTTDPKKAQGTVENTGTSLGAGLAVDVTRYNNLAYINNGTGDKITAGSIEVNANTAELSASAVSKAGYVAGNLGVAGAISVHLVSANNEAYVGGTVNLQGGELTVDSAIQTSNIVTNAEAAGDGADGENTDPDSVGVGAGIAVGVTNLAVISRILKDAVIAGNVGGLNINAGHTGSESMTATAGAAGGTSVVPVLAMNISGVSVLAEALNGDKFAIIGNALINATNSITRTITADAAAVGSGVGVGGSFIIDILSDSAKAKLNRSAETGGDLTVSADSISRLNATAKAGAQGNAGKDDGGSDSGGAGDDSGASGEEPPPSGESDKNDELPDDYYDGLDNLFGDNNSDAELDEDDDAESLAPLFKEGDADKFVDSNKESAQGLSSLVENENGNVKAADVGNAFENRQKAETSEGSVQVAATMVLNVQKNVALAQIGDVLNRDSETPEQIPVDSIVAGGKVTVTSRHDTDGVIMANASATNSTTGVGVAVAINTVTYSNIAEILADHITAGELIVRASVYESETQETVDTFFEAVKKDLFGEDGSMETFIDNVLKASQKGDLDEFVSKYLSDRGITIDEEGHKAILQMICLWVGELIQGQNPSYPEESKDNSTEEKMEDAKKKAAQYAKEIFNQIKKEFSDKNLSEQLFGKDGILNTFKTKIKDINLKEKVASALVGYLSGKLGGNEEAEGVGPKISTSAVSGAGATNVGVAGSVAISVVNGVSKAYIGDTTNGQMNVGGNITVESKASQDVYTSAGASVDALGRVDKNKADTDNANSTQGDASNADASKSVGVGAAVAMSFADLTSNAGIGSGWTIKAQDLLMDSTAENNVETTSVSGTDPLVRTEEPTDKPAEDEKKEKEEENEKAEAEEKAAKAMDYAVDASVSVTLIQNVVKTYLANSNIILGGNLNMLSSQSGETNTNASGYAMGNETAVGAAVAINLAFSDVATQLLGSGSVEGTASLDSKSENQDDATAMALAMGAEMERYMAKLRNAEKVKSFNKEKEEEKKDEENKDEKIGNSTADKISGQLKRASKVSDKEDEDKSDPSQPLSVQAIKSQNVKTESTNQTDADKNGSVGSTVTDATNNTTGDAVSGTLNDQAQEGQSIHVAASVGVNVTQHSAKTEIKGNLTVGGLKANVENTSNFTTASTGAAITEATNSNSVGAAVAVSVNGNKAEIEIPDGVRIVVTGTPADDMDTNADPILGNVALSTVLNQNSTGDALRRYGALAVAGSSSGKGGKVGLAGSIAVLVAKGTSAILLGDNVTITGNDQGSVSIQASDKSKLSAAAMAATKSGGVTAGVGASFALLYAENEVLAKAGDNFNVSAKDFTMTATKQAVSIKDFIEDADIKDYLTVLEVDSEGNGGYKTEDADKYGMIVVQKNQNGSYSIFTNLESADIISLIQLSSVLASVNYYASAVAGTVMERKGDTSNQKAAVAGAVSMLFNNSVTEVSIGNNANINTTGATKIEASGDANTRLLGGALSSSGAKAGIGLNVATAVQKEKVSAIIGVNPTIHAGSFTLNAHSKSDMLVITAAAVNASGTSVGGALNVAINNNSAKANINSDKANVAEITCTGDVNIGADVISDVILGSVTVSISGGTEKGASVGAIVSVTTNASAAEALVGDYVTIVSDSGAITISATNEEMIISVMAAAARSANGGAGAGTLSVLTTDGKAIARVDEYAKLTATNDITVSAMSKAKLIDLMAAVSASTDAPAVGATIMVNVFNRETGAYIGNNSIIISKLGNVLVKADSQETAIIISIAGAGASQNAISGNIQVNVGTSKTNAAIGNNANIKAWDSIGVTANQDSTVIAISPTVSFGSSSTAVGATVQTNVLSNEVKAIIGQNANLTAYAQTSTTNGVQTTNRETKRKGIILSALAKDLVVAGGVSAGAGKNAAAGVVETMVNKTIVIAKLGANAVVRAGFQAGDTLDDAFSGNTPSDKEGELSAEADSHSTLVLFGGAFSATSSTGIGATVLTLIYDKNVDAQILLSTTASSTVRGNVNVIAKAEDLVALVSVNFGVSNSTAANVGGNVLVFQDKVNANLTGNLNATGNVMVQADSSTDLINAIASVSGSLGGTAVSGAALVTYFQGKTFASVGAMSDISCTDLKVLATSTANINSDGVGLTASVGSAAVSGLVNIIVTSTETQAYIGSESRISATNDVSVIATDNYHLLAIAGNVSASGSAGVGVTAVVTVAKNTVLAYIGDASTVDAASLAVKALSNRDIRNYAGAMSFGGSGGVGVTVMVAVVGGKLDQDSANGIANGFKPDAFMSGIQSSVPNVAKGYLDNIKLSEDLAADGGKASDLNVGDKNGNYSGTDDYRSDDFDENYVSGSNPGENFNDDVTNTQGSELGMVKPKGDYRNVINAYIGGDCMINVTGETIVEANEKLNVDIVTASASVGGTAGVSVGVAVVVAYSNVLAEIKSGTVLNCANVTVHAISGGGDAGIDDDKASEALSNAGINAETSGSSIRAIAITVGIGGAAGVTPSVAVVNMASGVIARMDGVSGNAKVITAKAETVYPQVLAVTGAVGIGGTAGVSASVAVVTFNSETWAGIINSGELHATELNVLSNVDNTAKAYAMSLAGGTVGVNGGVAVVTNRSTTHTILGSGVYQISGNVKVDATVNTSAESYIVGVALGGVAVGLNAAVVNQHAVIVTQILGNSASSLTASDNVTVNNNITSTAKSTVIAVSGGAVGVGGNVLLVFNNMEATAAIIAMPFNVNGNVTVSAGMNADSEASLATGTVGGVAVGLSTSYVGLNAKNLAYLEIPAEIQAKAASIRIYAGSADDNNNFDATASTVAGGAGGVSVGLNAAVADINATNEAKILSKGTLLGSVDVQANAAAAALAEIYFASAGAVSVSAATVVSLLRISQLAEADIASLNSCTSFKVSSNLNSGSTVTPSYAKIVTISGGMYNVSANVAVAYSLSKSIAKAILNNANANAIDVYAGGAADAKSETMKEGNGVFSGSVSVNVAYAKAEFQSILRVLKEVSASNATVQTVYTTNSNAILTPSASKLDLSLISFDVNLAIAKVAAKALATLDGSGKLTLTNDLLVKADGSNSSAHADIVGAYVNASGISFGANIADSQMALEQTVSVNHVTVNAGNNINISGNANDLSSRAETGANAGVSIQIAGGKVNSANANVSIVNQVILDSAKLNALKAVKTQANSNGVTVNAIAKDLTVSVSGLNIALTNTEAKVTKFNTGVFMYGGSISGYNVEVSSTATDTKVVARSGVPCFSIAIVGIDYIQATAKILEKLTQVIVDAGTLQATAEDVILSANANASLKADSARPATSVGVINVMNYHFDIQVDKIQTEVVFNGNIDSARDAKLTAYDNITGEIIMNDTNIGGFSGTASHAMINVKNQTAYVKAAGVINAVNDIKIEAKADEKLKADVDTDSTNFNDIGYAKTDIILYRNAIVDVDGSLISKLGNIDIHSKLGTKDTGNKVIDLNLDVSIDTWVDSSPYPTGTGKLVSVAEVNVAEGSVIEALNVFGENTGAINIEAKSEGCVLVDVYRYVDKPIGGNRTYSIADVSETVQTNIGGTAKTRIHGKNVNIRARTSMDVRSISYALGNTNLSIYYPESIVYFLVDLDTEIRSADISAYDVLNISAYLLSTYVLGHCISEKEHWWNYNDPTVTIKGHIYGDVLFDNNTVLRANELNIKTFHPKDGNPENELKIVRKAECRWNGSSSFDENIVFSSYTAESEAKNDYSDNWGKFSEKKKFISGNYDSSKNNVYYTGSLTWSYPSLSGETTPSGKMEIYLGAGASGIYVDIDSNGNVDVKGLSSSVSKDDLVNQKNDVYHVDGSKLQSAVSKGSFSFKYDKWYGYHNRYDYATCADLVLNNASDKDVQLNNVNEKNDSNHLTVIQSNANADLILNNSGNFANGSIYVDMAGGDLILKNGAVLNANEIFISGAGTLKDEGRTDGRFQVINNARVYDSLESIQRPEIRISVQDDLDLLIQTNAVTASWMNDKYVYQIDKIISEGNIKLEVVSQDNKDLNVSVDTVQAGGSVSITVPRNLEGKDTTGTHIAGDKIVIQAGGSVGAAVPIRIDSQSGVKVHAGGEIVLTEVSGDLIVDSIISTGNGDVTLKTLDGSILDHEANQDLVKELDSIMFAAEELQRQAYIINDRIQILREYLKIMMDLAGQMAGATAENTLELLNLGRVQIDILHNVETIEDALNILNSNIEATEEEIQELEAEFNYLIEQSIDFIFRANEVQDKLAPNGIITGGNVTLNVNSASGEASVGTKDKFLGISAGGTVSISTGSNTKLDIVALEGYSDLYLNPITANTITIYALEGVFAAKGVTGTLLKAKDLTIRSTMGGDLGTESNPLVMDVEKVNLFGNNITAVNNRSLLVDLILAMTKLNLTVKGDLNYIDSGNVLKGIFASTLNLAVDGDIGLKTEKPAASGERMLFAAPRDTQKGMLINVDKEIYISARNACLESARSMIVESIRSSGNLTINTEGALHMADSDSAIYCNSLNANAFGYAGKQGMPLKVYTRNGASAESYLYGANLLVIPLVDEQNTNEGNTNKIPAVRVTGGISPDAIVIVDTNPDHDNCDVCEYLLRRALQNVLTYVHIQVDGEIVGQVTVEIPVDGMEEGSEVIVLFCRDGVVYAIRAVIRNGYASFVTDELGAFLVLEENAEINITHDGKFIVIDDFGNTLPFGGWL